MNYYEELKLLFICFLILIQYVKISEENVFVFLKSLISDSSISTDKSKIKFLLYPSSENLDYKEEIEIGNITSLEDSKYKFSLPLKIIIHGFLSNKKNGVVETIAAAYLQEAYEVNIIGIDWTELSTAKSVMPEIFYPTAAKNVAIVGKELSNFLKFLLQNDISLEPEDIHLIGFSLGAHIAGMTGLYFYEDNKILLGRISGLDPAGPLFQYWPEKDRLDKSDANFVDITHTNKEHFGFNVSLGHVDFYANGGGPMQAHCSTLGAYAASCSHTDAYKYFAKSIEENIIACECKIFPSSKFVSNYPDCMRYCKNPVMYGERCTTIAQGDYYLEISVNN